jgi:hypothetical protein
MSTQRQPAILKHDGTMYTAEMRLAGNRRGLLQAQGSLRTRLFGQPRVG